MNKIAAVTSTRADYGLLSNLIGALKNDQAFDFSLIVTGTHLSQKHGMTVQEIVSDGFRVDTKIAMALDDDDKVELTLAAASLTQKIAKKLKALALDAIIILGDRFEILPVAYAAALQNIKIIHLHGGEITLGAIDNKMRFAISHLADFHLTATKKSKQRLVSSGIEEKYVVNTGAIGVENAINLAKYNRAEIEAKTGFLFCEKNILCTFHPQTVSKLNPEKQISEVLDGLAFFQEAAKFISLPNADPGSGIIAEYIEEFSKTHPHVYLTQNLGHRLYLSVMKEVDVVVGNSSSGIIEAPAMGVPTVNIGDRQNGREKAPSIVECSFDPKTIIKAIQTVFSKGKKPLLHKHPYYQKDTCNLMLSSIKKFLFC